FAGALSAADRIWRDVRALSWSPARASSGQVAKVTVSVGVSLFPSRDVRSKDQLLRAAEASLLRSKRDGGDSICVFQHQGYIYSPRTSEAPAPATAATPSTPPPQKPPSNSEIVAARRI